MRSHCGGAPAWGWLRRRPGLEEFVEDLAMARKGERWQRVQRKDPDLQHLRTRFELGAAGEARSIGDPDHAVRVPFGDVINADQRGQLNGCADLLHALTRRRGAGILVVVDESTG